MDASTRIVPFDALGSEDLLAFQAHKDKILAAVNDRIVASRPVEGDRTMADRRVRLGLESAKILLENFIACARFRLPEAFEEYLDWLRAFLRHRGFDDAFLPMLFRSLQRASHAFLPPPSNDAVCRTFRYLRQREMELNRGGDAA